MALLGKTVMQKTRIHFLLAFIMLVSSILIFNPLHAESVNTSVTVGNAAPAFTANPAESPASDATTPTNVGANVTFQATATDSNSENYYLIICKTNSVTAVNGSNPTCGGGAWCTSSSTTSGSQASCSYTALVGDTEYNDWYGFVCDGNASAASCSSSHQGSGSSGSPFKVNHAPSFTNISNDSSKNPGQTITWTSTASDSDANSTDADDTVKLVVCKTTGLSAGDCDGGAGDRWCQSSFVASDPTCGYSIPSPTPDGSNNAYAYIVDDSNFPATGGTQGSASNYTVNNVAPTVTSVVINGSSDITLTESTTTSVTVTATITDTNSCQDISTATTSVFRSGVTFASCDTNPEDDDNNCYAVVTCSVVGAGNTCTGTSDASADYTCSVSLQYFADPTDTGTQYPSENWLATVVGTDDNSATHNATSGTPVEVLSLVAFDVTSSISYGSLSPGQSNDPLDKTITITETGNVGQDIELSGTDMTSGGNTITVGNQKYSLAASTAYAAGTALTTSATEAELDLQKTTSGGSPATKNIWWGILIPNGTLPGAYTGTITATAVKGETAGW